MYIGLVENATFVSHVERQDLDKAYDTIIIPNLSFIYH